MDEKQRAKRRRLNMSICKYFSSSSSTSSSSTLRSATAEESEKEGDGDQESTNDLTDDTVPRASNWSASMKFSADLGIIYAVLSLPFIASLTAWIMEQGTLMFYAKEKPK